MAFFLSFAEISPFLLFTLYVCLAAMLSNAVKLGARVLRPALTEYIKTVKNAEKKARLNETLGKLTDQLFADAASVVAVLLPLLRFHAELSLVTLLLFASVLLCSRRFLICESDAHLFFFFSPSCVPAGEQPDARHRAAHHLLACD